jgi:hypothetical protein
MRPKTLAEVAQLTLDGDSFDRCLANFLDEFYAAPNPEALIAQPVLLAPTSDEQGRVQDAYLAATAEELARAWPHCAQFCFWKVRRLFVPEICSSVKTH